MAILILCVLIHFLLVSTVYISYHFDESLEKTYQIGVNLSTLIAAIGCLYYINGIIFASIFMIIIIIFSRIIIRYVENEKFISLYLILGPYPVYVFLLLGVLS